MEMEMSTIDDNNNNQVGFNLNDDEDDYVNEEVDLEHQQDRNQMSKFI